jgi:hypothetical protein
MVTFDTFKNTFPSSFVGKLRESIIPPEEPISKPKIVSELYSELVQFKYHPSTPRDYIIQNKSNYVSRLIPTFYPRDYFLYYFCCKILEDEIAEGSVPGTYGGWRLGNKIRLREEFTELELLESAPNNSFNPFLWVEHWKDFQKKAFLINKSAEFNSVVKFDLANFYDNINISLLGKKLYGVCPSLKSVFIDLLIHFLNNWNKKFDGYSPKTVGLPQDELSDCSRLLANFYLQDYDRFIKSLCEKYNAQYLRYADDQLIYAANTNISRLILFEASKYLSKIGLNINTGKVVFFESESQFNQYWAFDIFELLGDLSNSNNLNEGVELFIKYKEDGIEFRHGSVLRRILSCNFSFLRPYLKHRLLSFFFEKDFLACLPSWALSNFYNQLDIIDREILLQLLDQLIDENHFNSFHYNLMLFYKKNQIEFDEQRIKNRIEAIRV